METRIDSSGTAVNPDNIRVCARCGLRYDWRKSASSTLKMTYCGSLCERADLGFTIDALIHTQRGERPIIQLPADVQDVPDEEPLVPGL